MLGSYYLNHILEVVWERYMFAHVPVMFFQQLCSLYVVYVYRSFRTEHKITSPISKTVEETLVIGIFTPKTEILDPFDVLTRVVVYQQTGAAGRPRGLAHLAAAGPAQVPAVARLRRGHLAQRRPRRRRLPPGEHALASSVSP